MDSPFKLNIVDRSGTRAGTLGDGHLLLINGWRIMSPWVEVRKLIHSVKNVRDKLLEENARRHPSTTPKPASDGTSKTFKISAVDDRADAGAPGRLLCKEVTNPSAYLHQGIQIKPRKPYLNSPRIVEARIGGKVRVDTLS
jgi:hypothetical protein